MPTATKKAASKTAVKRTAKKATTAKAAAPTSRDSLLVYDLDGVPTTGDETVAVEPGGIDPRLVVAREAEKARRAAQEVRPSAPALIDPRLIADRAVLKSRQAELRKGRPATEGFQSS